MSTDPQEGLAPREESETEGLKRMWGVTLRDETEPLSEAWRRARSTLLSLVMGAEEAASAASVMLAIRDGVDERLASPAERLDDVSGWQEGILGRLGLIEDILPDVSALAQAVILVNEASGDWVRRLEALEGAGPPQTAEPQDATEERLRGRWTIEYAGAPVARCWDCGLRYGDARGFCDLVVPDDVWTLISPSADQGSGLLCPTCMCRRAAMLGLRDVPAVFRSGPFCAPEPPQSPAERAADAIRRDGGTPATPAVPAERRTGEPGWRERLADRLEMYAADTVAYEREHLDGDLRQAALTIRRDGERDNSEPTSASEPAPAAPALPVEGEREALAAWLDALAGANRQDEPARKFRRIAALLRALPEGERKRLTGDAAEDVATMADYMVQRLADSSPEYGVEDAQELLAGTIAESWFVISSERLAKLIRDGIEDAVTDGALSLGTPEPGAPSVEANDGDGSISMDTALTCHALLTAAGVPEGPLAERVETLRQELLDAEIDRNRAEQLHVEAVRLLAQRGPEGERYQVRIAADHLCRLRAGNAVRLVSVWTLGPASWLPEGHWTDVHIIVPPEGRAEGGRDGSRTEGELAARSASGVLGAASGEPGRGESQPVAEDVDAPDRAKGREAGAQTGDGGGVAPPASAQQAAGAGEAFPVTDAEFAEMKARSRRAEP